MDPPELLDKQADSTFALIEAAIKKSYKVHIYTVDDLTLEKNDLKVFCKEVKDIDINKIDFIKLSEKSSLLSSPFRSIGQLCMVSPSFCYNLKQIYLERISKIPLVIKLNKTIFVSF